MSRRRILLAAAVVLVLFAGAFAVALREFLDPARLRAHIVRATSEATGLDVSLGEAKLTFVPLAISLKELRIGDASDPFVEMGSGLARLDAGGLLHRSLDVEELVLEQPRIRLHRDETGLRLPGRLGAGEAASSGGGGTPPAAALPAAGFRGSIRSFAIENGSVHLATPGGAEDATVEGIDLRGSLDVAAGARTVRSEGTLKLQGLSLAALELYRETLDRMHPVVDFRLEVRPLEGVVDFESLRLLAEPLDLTVHGVLTGLPAAPVVSLELDPARFDLAELLPLVPSAALPPGITPKAAGPVRIAATVKGPLGTDPPEVSWSAMFEGATFGTAEDPALLDDLRGEIRGDVRSAFFRDVTAKIGKNGSVAAEGSIGSIDDPDSLRWNVTVKGETDLDIAQRLGVLPEGVTVSGHAALDARAEGIGGTPPDLDGTLTLRDAGARTPDLPVPATDWSGTARLTGHDVVLETLDGKLGSSDLHVKGRVENVLTPKVTLTGHSGRLDLVELAPPAPPAEPGAVAGVPGPAVALPPLVPPFPPFPLVAKLQVDSLITEGARMAGVTLDAVGQDGAGTVDAHVHGADYGGVILQDFHTKLRLDGQTAAGDFLAPRVQAFHIPMTQVQGKVNLGADRQLRLTDMKADAWNGSVQGTALVDLTDPTSPGFDIRTDAKALQANDFVSSLTPARNLVFGTVDVSSSFRGQGATPEEIAKALTGNGTFSAHDGRIAKTPTIEAIWKTLNLGEEDAVPFRDLLTKFAVENGQLITDGITVDGANATWKAAGAVSFTGDLNYDVEVQLDDRLSDLYRQRLGKDLANLFAGTSGRLAVDLKIRGNTTKPTVTLDREKLAARASERARDQVDNALKSGLQQGLKKLLGGSAKPASPPPPDSGKSGG